MAFRNCSCTLPHAGIRQQRVSASSATLWADPPDDSLTQGCGRATRPGARLAGREDGTSLFEVGVSGLDT